MVRLADGGGGVGANEQADITAAAAVGHTGNRMHNGLVAVKTRLLVPVQG